MKKAGDIRNDILVLRAQAGEAEALGQLVEIWQPRLWAFSRALTGEDQAAWDITQDVWLAVLRGLPRLQDNSRFKQWVFQIARNKCADKVRRAARRRKFLRQNAPGNQPKMSTAPMDVRDALSALPEQDASVLALHYVEGASYEELAAIFNVPVGTVKSRLHNARTKLRVLWENQNG